jgi:hypothetical protein
MNYEAVILIWTASEYCLQSESNLCSDWVFEWHIVAMTKSTILQDWQHKPAIAGRTRGQAFKISALCQHGVFHNPSQEIPPRIYPSITSLENPNLMASPLHVLQTQTHTHTQAYTLMGTCNWLHCSPQSAEPNIQLYNCWSIYAVWNPNGAHRQILTGGGWDDEHGDDMVGVRHARGASEKEEMIKECYIWYNKITEGKNEEKEHLGDMYASPVRTKTDLPWWLT